MESTNQFLMMIINRVIDCNKVSHGIALVSQQETIDLKDTLQMPIDSIRDLHNTDIHGRVEIILSDISDGICQHIITDKQWLQENMLCLLSNAVKFSVGGKVRISVSVCRQSATPSVHRTLRQFSRSTSNSSFRLTSSARVPNSSVIERSSVSLRGFPAVDSEREISNHSLSADSETLLLFQVEDSGIGLNEAAMSKLFEPFAQAQRMTGGTGLGLYSLAKRTLSLGGKYGVYNRRKVHQHTQRNALAVAVHRRCTSRYSHLRSSRLHISHLNISHLSISHMTISHLSNSHLSNSHLSNSHLSNSHLSNSHLSISHLRSS
jgi:signal transduction histidine kinase